VNIKKALKREVRNGKVVYIPQKKQSQPVSLTPFTRLSLAVLLVIGTVAIAGALWLSIQYLINPDVAFWADSSVLGQRSVSNAQAEQPKSIAKIEDGLRQDGFQAGPQLTLKTQFGFPRGMNTPETLLIPVFPTACTSGNCSITELRQYQALRLPFLIRLFQAQPLFRLVQRISIQGPSESDLVSLEQNPLLSGGSEQSLPITQMERYDLAPNPGVWIRLTGIRSQGSGTSTYGQIFHYSPDRDRLRLMLNWLSPPGDFPRWQEVTGNTQPELVINQTIGNEPQYQVYQLKTTNGEASQLQPVALDNLVLSDLNYQSGLRLARSGLWSDALEFLNRAKGAVPEWKAEAQAQLDVVQLHAKITQFQAAQPSSSNAQRVLAYLVNGSWKPALQVFQSDKAASLEVKEMLAADSGRLRNRVKTALEIQPGNAEAIAWGALLKQASSPTVQAIAWAQQQPQSTSTSLNLAKQSLLQMDRAERAANFQPAPPPKQSPTSSPSPTSGSISTSSPIPTPTSQVPFSPTPELVPSPTEQPAAEESQSEI
jgi:hypothetical protein